jgi:putative FmdB family regulatory protein
MPIYEYRCGACAHTLDALQKLSDPPLTDCPECGAVALKKLVSAPVFRLKGGGWYETDFKSDKEKRRNLADGSGTEPAAKGGDAAAAKGSAEAAGAANGAGAGKAEKPKAADSGSKSGKGGDSSTKASGSKGAGTAAA